MENRSKKKDTLETILVLYDSHSKLFQNALADISDEDARNRLNTKANHMAWIAGSLTYQRYFIAATLGVDLKQTSGQLFENFKGIQDNVTYPSLAEFRQDWQVVTPQLRDAVAGLSEETLNGPDPMKMPGGDYTLFDTFTFCVDRESYCIGQLGLFRRLLGYDAMKYD